MGRSASKLTRRIDTKFNVEHRAQRALDKQQVVPKAPPKHQSSVELLKQIEKDYPELKQQQSLKDKELDERLKQVRIESFGPPAEIKAKQKLPQNRAIVDDPEFGHIEPKEIPKGHLSIRQLIEGLEKSMVDPVNYTHLEFAADYDIDPQQAFTIFKYFKPYQLLTDANVHDDNIADALKRIRGSPSTSTAIPSGDQAITSGDAKT